MSRLHRVRMVVAVLLPLGVSLLVPAGAAALTRSLPQTSNPRPGPDILYRSLAKTPQLGNGDGWDAKPILVSGASAYRDGEFLYQDFLYDDHGANGRPNRDPEDDRTGDDAFSEPNGTYTYPDDNSYAENAADLLEFRVEPRRNATAFRLSYNTMKDPDLVGTTIAIGDSNGSREYPHGANAKGPAQLFLTVHGDEADLVDAETGEKIDVDLDVKVSERRRQVEVRVPHDVWDPGKDKVRMSAGTGLWDVENSDEDRYLLPKESRTGDTPGGSGSNSDDPPAFFNVAFRYDEPRPDPGDLARTSSSPAWWRDRDQGERLRDGGDMRPFYAKVDFGKLKNGDDDNSDVPKTGPIDRILVSHFETKQGVDFKYQCGRAGECKGELRGRLQPYSIYVPEKKSSDGYGLTLLLHSLGANYNQYLGSKNQSQLGDRDPGSIVITPTGRGPDGWYYDHAGADTFEVWADVAHRYKLDPDYTVVTGYSMGGYGTFKFATRYPDLFAKAQTTVGPPGLGYDFSAQTPVPGGPQSSTYFMLESVRNIPFLMWVSQSDELVPFNSTEEQARRFDDLDYRYIFDSFVPVDHLGLAIIDRYGPVADFLGDTKVDRNPQHVNYVINPTMDFPQVGTVGDHAYWLSKMRIRDEQAPSPDAPRGKIDVFSHGFGKGDPQAGPTEVRDGPTLVGNSVATSTEQRKDWLGGAPDIPKRNRLDIKATNVRRVDVNVHRARVSCGVKLNVETDGPLKVHLEGCGRTESFSGSD